MIAVIFMYIFLFVSIGLALLAKTYLNKIRSFSNKEPEKASKYGMNVIAGIVSGVVVIVLDRIISSILQIDFSFMKTSFFETIISATGILIGLFFKVSLLLFLVFYIIHKGMR